MAKPNYSFQKRQRELAKKQKKEAKKAQKAAERASNEAVPGPEADGTASPPAPPDTPAS